MSPVAYDLIDRLLCMDVDSRLGSKVTFMRLRPCVRVCVCGGVCWRRMIRSAACCVVASLALGNFSVLLWRMCALVSLSCFAAFACCVLHYYCALFLILAAFFPFVCIFSHLGSLSLKGAQEIKEHVFFKDINWETLRTLPTPFVPKPEDAEDVSYFNSTSLALARTHISTNTRGTLSPLKNLSLINHAHAHSAHFVCAKF